MRIGIDTTPLPPQPVGAGTYIIQLVRSLVELDTRHQFVIFAQRSGRAQIETPSMANREADHIRWVTVPNKKPALRLLWEQTILPVLVRRLNIDLLHSLHYTRPLVLPCASVVTFHDMTFLLYPELHTRAKRLFFPAAIRFSARHADAIIAVSESTRQDILRLLSALAHKVTAVPLAADPSFQPIAARPSARSEAGATQSISALKACQRKYNLPEEFILYVGIIEPRKNLPVLIHAYHRLVEAGCSASLVIAGRPGWMYEGVLRQVQALNLSHRVVFTGYIPAEDLPIVYNLARVFVYPSLYEGFGLPPLEAMACGTPVITSAVSSMIEIVADAGILVPPHDERGLAEAIQAVLEHSDLYKQLSERGRSQAAKFTWKRTAQETLKVYQSVVG